MADLCPTYCLWRIRHAPSWLPHCQDIVARGEGQAPALQRHLQHHLQSRFQSCLTSHMNFSSVFARCYNNIWLRSQTTFSILVSSFSKPTQYSPYCPSISRELKTQQTSICNPGPTLHPTNPRCKRTWQHPRGWIPYYRQLAGLATSSRFSTTSVLGGFPAHFTTAGHSLVPVVLATFMIVSSLLQFCQKNQSCK